MRIEEGSLRVLVSIPLKKGGRACRIRPDFKVCGLVLEFIIKIKFLSLFLIFI